jgi:hypothetical protein
MAVVNTLAYWNNATIIAIKVQAPVALNHNKIFLKIGKSVTCVIFSGHDGQGT